MSFQNMNLSHHQSTIIKDKKMYQKSEVVREEKEKEEAAVSVEFEEKLLAFENQLNLGNHTAESLQHLIDTLQLHLQNHESQRDLLKKVYASINAQKRCYSLGNDVNPSIPVNNNTVAKHCDTNDANSIMTNGNLKSNVIPDQSVNLHNPNIINASSTPKLNHNINQIANNDMSGYTGNTINIPTLTHNMTLQHLDQVYAQKKQEIRNKTEDEMYQVNIPAFTTHSEITFIPSTMTTDFVHLVGMEEVVSKIQEYNNSGVIAADKVSSSYVYNPFLCSECGTDFTPLWKRRDGVLKAIAENTGNASINGGDMVESGDATKKDDVGTPINNNCIDEAPLPPASKKLKVSVVNGGGGSSSKKKSTDVLCESCVSTLLKRCMNETYTTKIVKTSKLSLQKEHDLDNEMQKIKNDPVELANFKGDREKQLYAQHKTLYSASPATTGSLKASVNIPNNNNNNRINNSNTVNNNNLNQGSNRHSRISNGNPASHVAGLNRPSNVNPRNIINPNNTTVQPTLDNFNLTNGITGNNVALNNVQDDARQQVFLLIHALLVQSSSVNVQSPQDLLRLFLLLLSASPYGRNYLQQNNVTTPAELYQRLLSGTPDHLGLFLNLLMQSSQESAIPTTSTIDNSGSGR